MQNCFLTDMACTLLWHFYWRVSYASILFSVQEAELLTLVNNTFHQPFTMLWPTDKALSSLPENMQKWLYHKEHRGKLAAYLKGHMIRDTQVSSTTKCTYLSVSILSWIWCGQSNRSLPPWWKHCSRRRRRHFGGVMTVFSFCESKLKLFI